MMSTRPHLLPVPNEIARAAKRRFISPVKSDILNCVAGHL